MARKGLNEHCVLSTVMFVCLCGTGAGVSSHWNEHWFRCDGDFSGLNATRGREN